MPEVTTTTRQEKAGVHGLSDGVTLRKNSPDDELRSVFALSGLGSAVAPLDHGGPLAHPHTPAACPKPGLFGPFGTASMVQQGSGRQTTSGVCTSDLQLVITSAEECFLDAENLKRQERLLRSFEKLTLKLGSRTKGLLRPVELVAAQ